MRHAAVCLLVSTRLSSSCSHLLHIPSRQSHCSRSELILPLLSFKSLSYQRWFLQLLFLPSLGRSLLDRSFGMAAQMTTPIARSWISGLGQARLALTSGTSMVRTIPRESMKGIANLYNQAPVLPRTTSTLTLHPRTLPTPVPSRASRSPMTRLLHGTARPCFVPN